MDQPSKGRPPGKSTIFWTEAERQTIRDAMDELAEKLPHRTTRAIVQMMLRIEDGEFE